MGRVDRKLGPVGERPMEGFIGFLCLTSGLPMVLFGLAPDSATRVMPEFLIRTWGTVLTLGGLLVVMGILLRFSKKRFIMGLLIERAGYWPLISGTLIYSVVIALRTGIDGLFPIMTYVVFAAVAWLRQHQIARMVNRLHDLAGEE